MHIWIYESQTQHYRAYSLKDGGRKEKKDNNKKEKKQMKNLKNGFGK